MMVKKLFCIFAVLILLSGGDVVLAESVKKISAVYTTWVPYNFETEDGKAMGFENEIFSAVMATMKIEVDFIRRPWKRCLHMLQYGEVDALVSLLIVDERKKFTIYTGENISISRTLLFTHVNSRIQFDGSIEKLKPYTIGTTRGFSYGSSFDNATYLHKEEVNKQVAIVEKVVRKRNDFGIGNQLVIIALAEKLKKRDSIRFLEPPVHMQKLYVGFSKAKGLEKLAKAFTKTLIQFKKSDNYQKILRKYGIVTGDMTAD